MTLTDAGPLVALVDHDDQGHRRCVQALPALRLPLATTLPALTEAMYILGDRIGWAAQELLWRMIDQGELVVLELSRDGLARARDLMSKYCDLPMDLADATLVAAAEETGASRMFSLDRYFRVYRLRNRKSLEVIPEG